jgi:hypothetical protein
MGRKEPTKLERGNHRLILSCPFGSERSTPAQGFPAGSSGLFGSEHQRRARGRRFAKDFAASRELFRSGLTERMPSHKYRLIMLERQLPLEFRSHGGMRRGAGRKRAGRECVPHRARPRHNHAHPVLVTLRVRGGLPPLRHAGLFAHLREAVRKASASPTVGEAFRVVQFSIQDDHAHFIIEAHDKDTLSRGLRGLAIRLARAVNRAIGVSGQVWGDRYHARDLKTPLMVRNGIVYVLMNAKKHHTVIDSGVDAFSSAPWFDGFVCPVETPDGLCPVYAPRTWLGGTGWRRCGLVRFDERPS